MRLSCDETLGDGGERPVEPGRQGIEVGGFHRSTTPDPKTRRGVAVAANVQGDTFLLQQVRQLLGNVGLGVGSLTVSGRF